MEQVIGLTLLIIFGGLGIISLLLIVEVLFKTSVSDTLDAIEYQSRRSLWLGVVNAFFFTVIFVVFAALGESSGFPLFFIPAFAVLGLSTLAMACGLSAMGSKIGRTLFPNQITLNQNVRGSGMLYLACLVPFVGWFALLPYVAILGFGGCILGWYQRRQRNKLVTKTNQ